MIVVANFNELSLTILGVARLVAMMKEFGIDFMADLETLLLTIYVL